MSFVNGMTATSLESIRTRPIGPTTVSQSSSQASSRFTRDSIGAILLSVRENGINGVGMGPRHRGRVTQGGFLSNLGRHLAGPPSGGCLAGLLRRQGYH